MRTATRSYTRPADPNPPSTIPLSMAATGPIDPETSDNQHAPQFHPVDQEILQEPLLPRHEEAMPTGAACLQAAAQCLSQVEHERLRAQLAEQHAKHAEAEAKYDKMQMQYTKAKATTLSTQTTDNGSSEGGLFKFY